MRNMIIAITIITLIIGSAIYTSSIEDEISSEDIAILFINNLFTATPETYNDIYSNDGYDIGPYVKDNIVNLVTDKMLVKLYANRDVTISSSIAMEYNANVTVENLELSNKQINENKEHYDFNGTIRITMTDTNESVDYPFSGQVGLVKENSDIRVFALRLFSINLIDHRSR